MRRLASTLLFAFLFGTDQASAGGFQLFGFSVEGDATATSNQVAVDNASIAYWNPAGSVWLSPVKETNIAAFAQIVSANHVVEVDSARAPVPPGVGTEVAGNHAGKAESLNLIPDIHVTRRLSEAFAVGLSLTAPFGLPTSYDADWKGRYFAIDSKLTSINLNPSFSLQVNEHLSLGGGVDFLYVNAELSNAIDLSTACLAQAVSIPALGAACAASGFATPGSRATDGRIKLEGDDIAAGWNVAAMWRSDKDDTTRVGVSYRSEFNVDVTGTARYSLPANTPAFLATNVALQNTSFASSVTLPATAAIGVSHKVNNALQVFGSVTWTDWSVLNELRIRFNSDVADSVTPFSWSDSYRYAIGARLTPQGSFWSFSGGIAYDQTPVNGSLRSPRVPDSNKILIGVGTSYKIDEHSQVDLAYDRVQFEDAPLHLNDPVAGSLVASVKDEHLDVVSAQYNYHY